MADFSDYYKISEEKNYMKTIAPAYFPPISFFKKIINLDSLFIYSNSNYQKQSYRNRCIICNSNGRQNLIIPINHKKKHKKYKDVVIHYDNAWQKNHWKSLESAYKSSPFFEYYKDELSDFFFKKHTFLFELNYNILIKVFDFLELTIDIKETDQVNDFEEIEKLLDPKKKLIEFTSYNQVFRDKNNFETDLTILDALFNIGPETSDYIKNL